MIQGKVIAIDFDGTITDKNIFPNISDLRENAKEVIKKIAKNNIICIWTCRYGEYAKLAYNFLVEKGIPFNYFNESPGDKISKSRKIIADYYIDDCNLFCNEIDWKKIEKFFCE